MVGYIKLKTNNQELYETNYLEKLKEKDTKLAHLQYFMCYLFLEFVVWIKYIGDMITIKKIYHAYLFIFPFELKEGKNMEFKLKKCSKKMQKFIKKYQIDTIVLAEELEKKLTISMEGLEKEQQEGFKNRDISKKQQDSLNNRNILKKQQDSSNNRNISKKKQDGSKDRNISLKEKTVSKDWKPLKEKQKQNQINLPISRKVKLLNGKGLMPYLIKEILEYIMEKQNTKTQLEDIYFCIKESNPIYIQNIYNLTPYFKTVNIITPNITKFQKMADKIEEAEGSMITIINNKKKSLKKAQWIVNFDFTKEELKSYTIFRRAIILAIKSDGEYDNICFEGALIQKAKIDTSTEIKEFFERYHLLGNCSLEVLYESLINEKQGLIKVKQKMEQDQIKVIKLYGSNLNFRQLTKYV